MSSVRRGGLPLRAQVANGMGPRTRDLRRESMDEVERVEDELGLTGPGICRRLDPDLAVGKASDVFEPNRRSSVDRRRDPGAQRPVAWLVPLLMGAEVVLEVRLEELIDGRALGMPGPIEARFPAEDLRKW